MGVVQSFGAVKSLRTPTGAAVTGVPSTWALSQASRQTYAAIYRTQPEVRTVVDFLGRCIAELNLHAYRRVSDTDRERVSDHEVVSWIDEPNPAATSYRLWESTMLDMGIYYSAYWLKVRLRDRLGLVRLPPEEMEVSGYLLPSEFTWTKPDGNQVTLAPNGVVYFTGYDPSNPIQGLSPIETLRKILAAECASTDYQERYWRNAARLEGVIERPATAPRWTSDQKQSWREQWQGRFAGNPGQVAVLEDGMTFKPASFSMRESEFNAARKLTREEVAAAYHIPLPMVGILDHATFSNVKEQHKHLYQDSLGPWCKFLSLEVKKQLLPEADDIARIYFEFNLAEKLKGSFEEQGTVMQQFCGRPIMTGNEGRARLNLPSIKDDETMNQVVLPLNTGAPGDKDDELDAGKPTAKPALVKKDRE